jgi:hypothetical protein
VLYQKNIEAHAEDVAAEERRSVEEIICEQVRLTVLTSWAIISVLTKKRWKTYSASLPMEKEPA